MGKTTMQRARFASSGKECHIQSRLQTPASSPLIIPSRSGMSAAMRAGCAHCAHKLCWAEWRARRAVNSS